MSISSDSTDHSSSGDHHYHMLVNEMLAQTKREDNMASGSSSSCTNEPSKNGNGCNNVERLKESLDLKLNLHRAGNEVAPQQKVKTPDISITRSRTISNSSSSTATSGPDSTPPSPLTPPHYPSYASGPESPASPSSIGQRSESSCSITYNMTFPENSVTYAQSPGGTVHKSAKEQVCGVFSVDLGKKTSIKGLIILCNVIWYM